MQPNPDEINQRQQQRAEWQCQYKGKICYNHRLVLRDGTQVKLCEFHRTRANYNQRSYHERRRSGSQQDEASAELTPSPNHATQNAENEAWDEYLALAERMRREDEEHQRER